VRQIRQHEQHPTALLLLLLLQQSERFAAVRRGSEQQKRKENVQRGQRNRRWLERSHA
jgi:hypothetical protein